MTQPVFRFAPSPNGYLHLGHALSAILNHRAARRCGGRFLLRIEDIDPARALAHHVEQIFDDLAWLGLAWEEPVRRQSRHMPDYAAAIGRLEAAELLYPCFCTRRDIAAATRDADPDGAPLYPGTCRRLPPAGRRARLGSGASFALRLDMGAALERIGTPLTFAERDPLAAGGAGTVLADPARWGDVVIRRKDVPTSYHLSVVVDDGLQGITHVVRGLDLKASTDVHRVLQTLLGLPAPLYHHHRLILGADGRKLSKSAGAISLRRLREQGAAPADICRAVGLEAD